MFTMNIRSCTYMYVYTDHNLPQGESKLKIESPFFKMQRQLAPFFSNSMLTLSVVFYKNLKTRKTGTFVLKFTGVDMIFKTEK